MIDTYKNISLLFFTRKLAEEELQTNIAQIETYTLPSGQEIQKEYILSHSYNIILLCKLN